MALPPAAVADDSDDALDAPDAAVPAADDVAAPEDDEATDQQVLLTVCKEADGSYSLIEGDEEEAGAAAEGAMDEEGTAKKFDNKGALLKAILDILNEDEAAAGGEAGSSEDQFQSGFGGPAAPGAAEAAPAAPLPQKY